MLTFGHEKLAKVENTDFFETDASKSHHWNLDEIEQTADS